MGSVHFGATFWAQKKAYKVENQLIVDYSERREGLATWQTKGPPRLTPIPSARRRGPCKPNCAKSSKLHPFVFYALVHKQACNKA